jgi:hypothetical protein
MVPLIDPFVKLLESPSLYLGRHPKLDIESVRDSCCCQGGGGQRERLFEVISACRPHHCRMSLNALARPMLSVYVVPERVKKGEAKLSKSIEVWLDQGTRREAEILRLPDKLKVLHKGKVTHEDQFPRMSLSRERTIELIRKEDCELLDDPDVLGNLTVLLGSLSYCPSHE